jgi:Putative auto-transporter adhesin, head GIN domain
MITKLTTPLLLLVLLTVQQSAFAQKSFSKLVIDGTLEVAIEQNGNTMSIVGIAEDANDKETLTVEEEGSTIHVSSGGPFDKTSTSFSCSDLTEIEISGTAKVVFKSHLSFNRLKLVMDGTSDAPIHLECQTLNLIVKGANDLTLEGSCNTATINVSGTADVNAKNFMIENATVTTDGSTTTWINVKKNLKATASGTSNLYYKTYLVSKKPKKYLPAGPRKATSITSTIKAW